MKKLPTILLIILFALKSFAQQGESQSLQRSFLKRASQEATIIFEGKVIKKNKSFWGNGDNKNDIYSSYTVQVNHVLSGNIKIGTIEIVVLGGQLERDGIIQDSHSEEGDGMCIGNAMFFIKPSLRGTTGIVNINVGDFDLVGSVCYRADGSIETGPYDKTYSTKEQLYKGLSEFRSIEIPTTGTNQESENLPPTSEKKSPNVGQEERKTNESIINPSYEQNLKNYDSNLALLLEKFKIIRASTERNSAANEITFSLANPTVTGSNPRYFEFDITAATSSSSIYYDGALFRLAYNTDAFGSEIVKNNKVIVTRGTTFNGSTYTDPNADKKDQTLSVIGVPLNVIFNAPSLNRTLLSNTPVQLLHFKIEIQSCGKSVDVDFEDQDFTNGFSTYSSTANASVTDALFFSTTTYQNPLNDVVCQILINNFNSPVKAGVGDILEINGKGFGNNRGNGQVKFKNANDGGKTYLQKLDPVDYLSWSDNLIKIKIPSIVDSATQLPPGSGDFIVKNDLGDSAISNKVGKPFEIYYTLLNSRISGNKYHTFLHNRNNLGGYTIRLDTSVTNHPQRIAIVKKAISNWKCAATVNFLIGKDTIINGQKDDGFSTIYFGNTGSLTTLGSTQRQTSSCAKPSIVSVIREFDIVIQEAPYWSYDTTGKVIPAGQYSLLEVITHELGHAFGLRHVNDITRMMFYATQSSGNVPRELEPYKSDVDGALDQVSSSISTINLQCGWTDLQPSNANCRIVTEIEQFSSKNFYLTAYPNPVSERELNISFESPTNYNSLIAIYDLMGKEVYKLNIGNTQNLYTKQTINVLNLPAGVYFINVLVDNSRATVKFIKN